MASIDEVLECLNKERIRATYGAVGPVIGCTALEVQDHLQAWNRSRGLRPELRHPETSWVVAAASGEPSGYAADQQHPELNRFVKERVKGIEKERPRGGNHGGKDSERQAKLRARIIEATTQTTPKDATHWSTRTMARAMGTTHSFVHRVWQSHGLKPHLIRTFKVSNDPRFEEKLHDVVGLYLNPPENAVVFSVDEKSSVQALDRTQPGLPIKKGRCGTMTHDYKRHGTTTLFAALDVATGAVIGESYRRHRHQEVLRFLKKVEKTVPKEQELHIILDNYATHKHEEVLRGLPQNLWAHPSNVSR